MSQNKCKAKTKSGAQCSNSAKFGDYCGIQSHKIQDTPAHNTQPLNTTQLQNTPVHNTQSLNTTQLQNTHAEPTATSESITRAEPTATSESITRAEPTAASESNTRAEPTATSEPDTSEKLIDTSETSEEPTDELKGQFFTPVEITERIKEMLIRTNRTYRRGLEPSVGTGNLLPLFKNIPVDAFDI